MDSDQPSGALLRLPGRREVALYRYDDRVWVAELGEHADELWSAGAWFALNARSLRWRSLRPPEPLSAEAVARIRHLHGRLSG